MSRLPAPWSPVGPGQHSLRPCVWRSGHRTVLVAKFCGFVSLVAGKTAIVCRFIAVLACPNPIAFRFQPVQSAVLAVCGSILTTARGLA